MIDLFIFGNSYNVNQIIYDQSFVFSFQVDNIILLSEMKRLYYTAENINIKYYDTPTECIDNSSIVIILKDDNLPVNIIDYIIKYSKVIKKKCYLFDNNESHKIDHHLSEEIFTRKPVVLCVYFGEAAQSLVGELMIERIFSSNGVKTYHIFSDKNQRLIAEIQRNQILSHEIENAITYTGDESVIIVGIDADKNPNNLRNHFNYISLIRPDYTLFQTDRLYNNREDLESIAKLICNRKLDSWIQSRYYLIEEKNIRSYQASPPITSSCIDIEDPCATALVAFDLLSKLAYPSGLRKF